jgi:hypothetical protein
MIEKTHLQSIISKYYLEGLIDSTKWVIKDNQLIIDFISPNKNLVGKTIVNDFILVDSELGIFDTTKLNKLISVTNKSIQLDLVKHGKKCSKLILSDNQFNINYSLADIMLISKVPQVEEPEYDIEAILENDDMIAMIRAKTALTDTNTIIIQPNETIDGKPQLEFIFGNNDEYSNRISYCISQLIKNNSNKSYKINYDSELFKLIMNANKEISRGKLYISLDGLMKLEFENDSIKSVYFLVQNELH